MVEIIGVRFKEIGKIYYFDPNGIKVKQGDRVIVETARGIECSEVVLPNREVDDAKVVSPLRKAIRMASEEDLATIEANNRKAKEAFAVCEKKIAQHKLDMKLIDVEYTFDGSKILFYFTADGRVDFRELVKDLAGVFRMRIELRQIGVRDEAKMYGGLGMCGRPLCCASFLDDFQPVSIKMAKEQGLSLNPTKISGTCGRLMCCLKYEQDAYEDLIRSTPKVDSKVYTPDGAGTVVEVNLLRGLCKVRLDDSQEPPKFYPKAECGSTKGGCCGGSCGKCGEQDEALPALIQHVEHDDSTLAAVEEPADAFVYAAEEAAAVSEAAARFDAESEAAAKDASTQREGGRSRNRSHRGQKPRQERRKPEEGNRQPRQEQKKSAPRGKQGENKPSEKAANPAPAQTEGGETPRDGEPAKKRSHHRGRRGRGGKGGTRPPKEGGAAPQGE